MSHILRHAPNAACRFGSLPKLLSTGVRYRITMKTIGHFALLLALGTASVASVVPTSAAADTTPNVSVNTKNFAYAPADLTVSPGTTVVFKNSDTVAHTVTASDKSFDSGDMPQNATWSHIFAKAGTYTYVCAYHSYMQGTITVK
jgi:plastocyanin